jgi:hypothetical protein
MEVLAIVGAIASIGQLIGIAGNISGALIELVEKLQNAPEELRRQQLTLRTIQAKLQLLQSLFKTPPTEARLPPYLWQEFHVSLSEVQKDIEIVAKTIQPYDTGKRKISSIREKLRFQICNEKALANATKHLRISEENLQRIESVIHL